MSNTSTSTKSFPKGLRNSYIQDDLTESGRGLLAKLHQMHGRVETKRCRDCAAFIRSRATYTAGRCEVISKRGHFGWRGDWVACGLIRAAEKADEELRKKKPTGRRPVIRIDVNSGTVITEPRRVRRKKDEPVE